MLNQEQLTNIDKAKDILMKGGVVACPTETVYGLFASALDDDAVRSIYEIKGRPSRNPLIVHIHDINQARDFCDIDDIQYDTMNKAWNIYNYSVSFVLRMKDNPDVNISKLATSGLETVAVRIPMDPVANAMLKACGIPLVAPSANTSNYLSPTNHDMVVMDLGDKVPLVLDNGSSTRGLESTIIDISSGAYRILRPGVLTYSEIHSNLGINTEEYCATHENIVAPGMMKKHYSPRIPMRINAYDRKPGEALVGFGNSVPDCDFNLSKSGDLHEAARNLYATLKKIEDLGIYTSIAISAIPEEGVGIAINDRLRRGSAPSEPADQITIERCKPYV